MCASAPMRDACGRVVTDAAYSRSFAQTHSLRIRQSSLLTGNGMIAPGCCHTNLIAPLSFARGVAASVQHRGNLVVAVSNSHTTNDLQRLHGRGRFRSGTRSLHRELRKRTSLPVNHQLKGFFLSCSAEFVGWLMLLVPVVEEEFSSFSYAAFDLRLPLWGRHEMAAFAALIEFDAVDIDTFASQLASEVDWVSGDPLFK